MPSILDRRSAIVDRAEYLQLAKQYHPDLIKDGGKAMAHINALYAKDYVPPNQLKLPGLNYNFVTHPHPNLWVGAKSALYATRHPPRKYSFPDTKAQNEMLKYLPVYIRQEDTYTIIAKPQEQYSLAEPEVLDKIVGTPHASWIVSSLYNILCYLEWAQLTHNALLIENIFIDPRLHSAHLYGGWEFSANLNSPLTSLPKGVYDLDPKLAKSKTASFIFDLKTIKRLGLTLKGDWTGMKLEQTPAVRFLRSPSTGSARADYKLWIASLGTRKFVELKL